MRQGHTGIASWSILAPLALLIAAAAEAEPQLALPTTATATGAQQDPPGLYGLPSGVFDGQSVPKDPMSGARIIEGWSVPLAAVSGTFELYQLLSDQIAAQGYERLLSCGASACGGFDFRRELALLAPPGMFVDLSDFYALSARRMTETGPEGVFLLVSRAGQMVTVQLTRIAPVARVVPSDMAAAPERLPAGEGSGDVIAPATAVVEDLDQLLERHGHAILTGVDFATGTSTLVGPPPASLRELAKYLKQNPDHRAVVVGHSDATGSASMNMALSKKRAAAVKSVLTGALGVALDQVTSDGVGFLAPNDTNATAQGRADNRRVEVVILPK